MKKIILFLFVSLFLVSCGYNTEETAVEETTVEETTVEETAVEETAVEETKKEVKTYTMDKVASYNTPEKCRTIIDGKVYDLTSFFGKHPGGDDNLKKLCGIEGTELFKEQHGDNEKVWEQLKTLYKGELKK